MARYDYTKIGLTKLNNITLFDNRGVNDLNAETTLGLANYGLFVILTRALAGHETDTDKEKKAIVQGVYDMLLSGKMRSGKKAGMTAEEKQKLAKETAIATMRKAVENGTPAEKKMVEGIIAKM